MALCSEHFEPHCYLKNNVLNNDPLSTASCKELGITECVSNDHINCKISSACENEEKIEIKEETNIEIKEEINLEIKEEMNLEIKEESNVLEAVLYSDNSINDENYEENVVSTSILGEKTNVIHVPDENEQYDDKLEYVGDDVRNTSIQSITETHFLWEKIPDQICRLCATKNEFHPKQSIVRWLGLLNQIVPGMVAVDDGLPQHVCKPCLKKLYATIRIKAQFTAADEKLRYLKEFKKSPDVESNTSEGMLQTGTTSKEDVDYGLDLPEDPLKEELNNCEHEESSGTEINPEANCIENEVSQRNEMAPLLADATDHIKENSVTLRNKNSIGHKRKLSSLKKIPAPVRSSKCKVARKNEDLSKFESEYAVKASPKHEIEDDENVEKVKYNCFKCGRKFSTKTRLQVHESMHAKTCLRVHDSVRTKAKKADELTCKICKGQFLFKKDLIMHVGTHHNGKPYGCDECGKRYRSNFRLKTHKMYHSPPTFSCPQCKKKFHVKPVLDEHIKIHSVKDKYICDVCGKSMSSESILEGHLRMHEGLKPYKCNLCGKCYQSFDCLRFHKLRHRSARFFCEICGKGTKDKTAMRSHMNTHTKELACQCPICLKTFANANSRAKHMKHTCSSITCVVCEETFDTVEKLQDHRMKEHCIEDIEKATKECNSDSIFCCEECNLYIAGIATVENHMYKVHNLDEVFKCNQCLKCFLSDDVLEEHANSCTVQKVRKLTNGGKCIFCFEDITGAGEIMKHMRSVHKDYKPYMCENCPKAFLTKKELECHSLCHADRRYQGPDCDKRFKTLQKLKGREEEHEVGLEETYEYNAVYVFIS